MTSSTMFLTTNDKYIYMYHIGIDYANVNDKDIDNILSFDHHVTDVNGFISGAPFALQLEL